MYQSSQGIGTCGYLRAPQTEILRKHDAFDTTLQLCENRLSLFCPTDLSSFLEAQSKSF